jgi:AsmA protein
MEGMNTTASFSGDQVRLSPLNIEEQFCKLVNLVTQNNTETVTWDNFTEMRQLNGNIVWRDQVINLESFNAGVSQLLLASTGQINLVSNKYEFKLPIKLTEASETATLKGCTLGTANYWVGRGLSLLRCKGSFDAINPAKDCGFDKSALGDLTKDYAEYKLREKHGAKIDAAEQKLKDKRQELLDDANKKLGGEGKVTKPKDLLNNFLRKKLGENHSSSAQQSSTVSSVTDE